MRSHLAVRVTEDGHGGTFNVTSVIGAGGSVAMTDLMNVTVPTTLAQLPV